MSEELIVLKEYIESLGFEPKTMSKEDLVTLKNELKDAGELGLARFVAGLSGTEELLDYLGEE